MTYPKPRLPPPPLRRLLLSRLALELLDELELDEDERLWLDPQLLLDELEPPL